MSITISESEGKNRPTYCFSCIYSARRHYFPLYPTQTEFFGFISFAGTSGVLLRKVNGTAIVQLPSKQQVQVRLSGLRCRICHVKSIFCSELNVFIFTGAGDLRGHSGTRVQHRPQQTNHWKSRSQSLARHSSVERLVAEKGRLGRTQD